MPVVSAVTSLLAALLLYTVNPSCLLHFRPLPTALCSQALFLPLLLCISLAGKAPCGVAATLAGVVPEDLAPVAREMKGGTPPGVRNCSYFRDQKRG